MMVDVPASGAPVGYSNLPLHTNRLCLEETRMTRLIAGWYAEIANTRRVGGQEEVFRAAELHQGGRPVAVRVAPATSDEIYRIYFDQHTLGSIPRRPAPAARSR